MFQVPLLTATAETRTNTLNIEGIKASVVQHAMDNYEILLEINSNKVLVAMQWAANMIEHFEIIAVKGFIELSTSFILTIRRLVEHVLCRIG